MPFRLPGLSTVSMSVLVCFLSSCSSFTARRFAVFTVDTLPAGGTVLIDNRLHRADGCEQISHSRRVRFERNPDNSSFSAYRAPMAGGVFGGSIGLIMTLFSPPLGLTILSIGGGVATLPAFVDHQISRTRWKRESARVPVILTFEHPDFPTRTVRWLVTGHATHQEALKNVQALRFTFEDDPTFILFKRMKVAGIRKLAIVAVVEPFGEFEQGLIEFGQGFFSLMERTADAEALVYVLPPGPGKPQSTVAGRRWSSSGGLLPGVPEEDPVRRIRVVEVGSGRIIFDSMITQREYLSAMKTQYFRRKSVGTTD